MTLPQLAVLTAMEYIALILLICRSTGKKFNSYLKPISIYAPIYVLIVVSRIHIPDFIILTLSCISIVIFIKVVFLKKLSLAMHICLISMLLPISVLQVFFIFILGLLLSRPVDFAFNYGLIVLGLTLITCKLLYLYVPINRLIQKAREMDRPLYSSIAFFTVLIIIYFLRASGYFELMNHRMIPADTLLLMGFSFALTAIGYYILNFILDLKEKNSALKKFKEFENLSVKQTITLHNNYEKHIQVICWLSRIYSDSKRIIWYIGTYLNNFDDDEFDEFDDDLKPRFCDMDDQVLAAYLYVKIKHLRNLGVNCEVNIHNNFTTVKSKITTYKLLEALEILIGEALSTSDKARSDLRIAVKRLDNGRPAIDIYNRNDLISGQDTSRMVYESYSLKTKEVGGLRKLDAITEEYNCRLNLQDEKFFHGEYLRLRYLL